jgi:predicted sulfurtransferase
VKINAYLEDVLGFTNVASLKGGIVNYARQLQEQHPSSQLAFPAISEADVVLKEDAVEVSDSSKNILKHDISSEHVTRHIPNSLFLGNNYVFDARMNAAITSEHPSSSCCETCGAPCATFSNCDNTRCHVSNTNLKNAHLTSECFRCDIFSARLAVQNTMVAVVRYYSFLWG